MCVIHSFFTRVRSFNVNMKIANRRRVRQRERQQQLLHMINRRQTDRKTRSTVILYIEADEIMCKEVGREQIMRERISLSLLSMSILIVYRAFEPCCQTVRQTKQLRFGHVKSLRGPLLATAAELLLIEISAGPQEVLRQLKLATKWRKKEGNSAKVKHATYQSCRQTEKGEGDGEERTRGRELK